MIPSCELFELFGVLRWLKMELFVLLLRRTGAFSCKNQSAVLPRLTSYSECPILEYTDIPRCPAILGKPAQYFCTRQKMRPLGATTRSSPFGTESGDPSRKF